MKKLFVFLTLLLIGTVCKAQSVTCASLKTTAPCVQLSWTANSMAVTVTNDPITGKETSGPGQSIIAWCEGSQTSPSPNCSTTDFATALSNLQSGIVSPTAWNFAFTPQTSTTGKYVVGGLQYSGLYNFAVVSQWCASCTQKGTGVGQSAPSAIFPVTLGPAPSSTPVTPSGLSGQQILF